MNQYLTRSVTELVYRVPDDIPEGAEGDPVPENKEAPRQDAVPVIKDGRSDGPPAHVSSEATKRECFPIPLDVSLKRQRFSWMPAPSELKGESSYRVLQVFLSVTGSVGRRF